MAKLIYRVAQIPHPFDKKRRAAGEQAICLLQQTRGELAQLWEQPIAIFNRDSEAEVFLAHLFEVDPEGKVIEIPQDYRDLFEARQSNRRKQ